MLETPQHLLAFEDLPQNDHAQLRAMFVAHMRDIKGMSEEAIVEAVPAYADERAARRAIARGRKLWRRLYAWPWRGFDEHGRPPANWWTKEMGTNFTDVLEAWAAG